jgi:hypothetical protein
MVSTPVKDGKSMKAKMQITYSSQEESGVSLLVDVGKYAIAYGHGKNQLFEAREDLEKDLKEKGIGITYPEKAEIEAAATKAQERLSGAGTEFEEVKCEVYDIKKGAIKTLISEEDERLSSI